MDRTKYLRRAVEIVHNDFQDLESTKYADSMKREVESFQPTPIYHPTGLPMEQQHKLMQGKSTDLADYPNKEYFTMI